MAFSATVVAATTQREERCTVAAEESRIGDVGRWLSASDFVSSASEGPVDAGSLGALGFPRNWPAVYGTCKALKALVGKKGRCAGRKVAVVSSASEDDLALVRGTALLRLRSLDNAERVAEATGMRVVRGWAVFEDLERPVNEVFVAERYAWNETSDGTRWIDFTPRPAAWPELLLAEALVDAEPTAPLPLTADALELHRLLLRQRFGVAADADAAAAEAPLRQEDEALGELPVDVATLVDAVVASRDAASMQGLEARLLDSEALAVQAVSSPSRGPALASALAGSLGDASLRGDALGLLVVLTDAAVAQRSAAVKETLLSAGILAPLVALLGAGNDSRLQEDAAAALGNLCHESRRCQDAVAAAGALAPLAGLLRGTAGEVAEEAAYALWNLSVEHQENSAEIVRLGAVRELSNLLGSEREVTQENAAGALMHLTMVEEARQTFADAGGVPRLCALLRSERAETAGQAAGALLNLASDGPELARRLGDAGAVPALVRLAREGEALVREYAAGALMNLMRDNPDLADMAFKEGALPVLAGLLSRDQGVAETLGALANLACGNAVRQAAVYKAQVTRRSVALLGSPDLETRRGATAVLMNLASHPKVKERIVEAASLQPLARCLSDADPLVRERAVGALANLLNDHGANVKAAYEQAPGMIQPLIALAGAVPEKTSHEARRQAAHALAMLASEEASCDAVWEAGAGAPLQALLKDSVGEAALGIMNLAWRSPEIKSALRDAGAIAPLVRLLSEGDAMAREYSAGALMNLSAGCTGAAVVHLQDALPAVPALVSMLKEEPVQAAEWSAGALANIAATSADAAEAAAGAGAAAQLVALLSRATPGGLPLVLSALCALSSQGATGLAAVRAACAGDPKARLRKLLDDAEKKQPQTAEPPELQRLLRDILGRLESV